MGVQSDQLKYKIVKKRYIVCFTLGSSIIYFVLHKRTQFTENSFALIPAQVKDGGPYHRHGTSQHRFL